MKKIFKRILKFFIETSVVILMTYVVFSAGEYLKAKKDAEKGQNNSVQQIDNNEQKEQEKEQQPAQEKKKMSKIELDEAMNNIIAKYKGNNEIGVVYKNFSTGYRYAVNDDKYFAAASTVKVAYAMKVYDRIKKGELSEDTDIPYNSSDLEEGAGDITNKSKKSSYKLDYVIQNMIQYSDNTATKMIVGSASSAQTTLINYFAELGVTLPAKEAKNNRVTPKMMEVVWTKLYNERDSYTKLLEYLENSEDSEWIKKGIPNKKIASKYGGITTYMHDTAIVFGNEDYMLLIYTNNLSHSGDTIAKMAKSINELTDSNM